MFLEVNFFHMFSVTHEKEETWPDGTHPMLFAESSCASQVLGLLLHSFFLAKVPFLVSFNIERGVVI